MKIEAEVFNTIITSTILVYDRMGSILFDLGFTYSNISIRFDLGHDPVCDMLDFPIYISTPIIDFVVVTKCVSWIFCIVYGFLDLSRLDHFGRA